jgi:SAM-dependent methyltransferase/methyltransferase-like protein
MKAAITLVSSARYAPSVLVSPRVTSYEELPYQSNAVYQSHPDALNAAARLAGLRPAPVERCRVLELGCASGGNLIPMAEALPESRFHGVDLSPRQIAEGRATADELGLANLTLEVRSIADVDARLGQFDYVICHGVYSWVERALQDKILTICAQNLAPDGVAYVSYNTYPGWHRRGLVRDMLRYHGARFDEPERRVAEARAFLEFLTAAIPDQEGLYARVVKAEADMLRDLPDTYLFHEHLEAENHPLYFYQFIERAKESGLQYIGESCWEPPFGDLPSAVQHAIDRLARGSLENLEQYLDFLRNRMFRRTLLCHARATLDRTPAPATLASLWWGALAVPAQPATDLLPGVDATFRSEKGRVTTDSPLIKALLLVLHEARPRPLAHEPLAQAVTARVPGFTVEQLDEALLRCRGSNLVSAHAWAPPMALAAGERPRTAGAARLRAVTGEEVPNLRHRIVDVSQLDRAVLHFLDGTRDRATLADELARAAIEGVFVVEEQGQPVTDAARLRAILGELIEPALARLAAAGLLLE